MSIRWLLAALGLVIGAYAIGVLSGTRLSRGEFQKQTAELNELEVALQNSGEEINRLRQANRVLTQGVQGRHLDDLFALFPMKFPAGNWAVSETIFEDCWFESADGVALHGWFLPHEDPRHVILLVHGNAGNVTHRAAVAQLLRNEYDAAVFVFDYRGYGRSAGRPGIDGMLNDARAARDFVAQRESIDPADVVLLGRSIGGAICVQLAAEDGARALILESTFASLKKVARQHYPRLLVGFLVTDRLNSLELIEKYHGPLLMSHGDRDQTIPIEQGQALFKAAHQPKRFVVIPWGDHNDPQSAAYYEALGEFLASLPPLKNDVSSP